LCIRGELGVIAGGGLILFGISSIRQNASVWGFVYQGAGKSDVSISKWFIKTLTLLEPHVVGLPSRARCGHDKRLVVRYEDFSLFVRLDIIFHPFRRSINQSARLRFLWEARLLSSQREVWMEGARDRKPLRVI